jgi:hypothetical protein
MGAYRVRRDHWGSIRRSDPCPAATTMSGARHPPVDIISALDRLIPALFGTFRLATCATILERRRFRPILSDPSQLAGTNRGHATTYVELASGSRREANRFGSYPGRVRQNLAPVHCLRLRYRVVALIGRRLPHRSRRAAFPHRALVEGRTQFGIRDVRPSRLNLQLQTRLPLTKAHPGSTALVALLPYRP